MTALGSAVSPQACRHVWIKRLSSRRHSPSRVHRANSVYSVPNGMSHSWPIARHCMPQKQTHQIAMIALRRAAPANGGFGPRRVGFVPAMAASSASTASTKASTSAKASHEAREVLAGLKAVPICCGSDGCCDGRRHSPSPSRASAPIHLKVASRKAPAGTPHLRTDSVSASRPLYAGRHLPSHQASGRLVPGDRVTPGFDDGPLAHDASSKGSLSFVSPTHTCSRYFLELFLQRSPPRLLTAAAWSGLRPAPESRSRGANPHLPHSLSTRSVRSR